MPVTKATKQKKATEKKRKDRNHQNHRNTTVQPRCLTMRSARWKCLRLKTSLPEKAAILTEKLKEPELIHLLIR